MLKSINRKAIGSIAAAIGLVTVSILTGSGLAHLQYYNYIYLEDYIPWVEPEQAPMPIQDTDPERLSVPDVSSEEEQEPVSRDEAAYERIASSGTFSPLYQAIYTYTGTGNMDCMSSPGGGYVVKTISTGTHVQAAGEDLNHLVIRFGDGIYAYAPKKEFTEGECYAQLEGAVDLRGYLPHAVFQLDFTTESNVTGRSLYPPIPMLELNAAQMLYQAAERFYEDGYTLVIHDAYRPITAQYAIWEAVREIEYVVDPYLSNSWHNVGRAVDISLIDNRTGREVELPTAVYEFDPIASRLSMDDWSMFARNNVLYINQIMEEAGFEGIQSEWWHYEMTSIELPVMENMLNYTDLVFEEAT